MKCPNCYHDNPDDALHCSECGENLQVTDVDEMNPEVQKSEKIADIENRRQKKKRRKQRNKIILIILVIAILAGLITAVAMWIGNENLNRTSTDDTIVMTEKPISTPEETPEETPEATPTESAVPEVSETPLPTVEVATPLPEQVTSPADNVEIIPETAPVAPAKTKKPTATKKPQATKKPAKTAAPVTPEQPQTPPPATADNSVATTNPPTGEALLGRFIQVNEYVNDSASGRQLIKFSVAGTEYYAYNTGKFITGNKGFYSVNGTTSGLYYNNLPIYNLTNIVSFTSDYVLPQSSSVLLSPNDLSSLTKAQMDIARNEIFARHGRTFKKADLQNYFNSKSWYHVNNNYNYSNERLNVSETEWANAELLLKYSK